MGRKRTCRSKRKSPFASSRSRLAHSLDRRLHVESLEDRRMLAVITVDSLLDNFDPDAPTTDGVVTLREAILAANTNTIVGDAPAGSSGADTINFDPTVFTGGANSLIRLGGTELEITESLTLDGSTGTDVVITADADGDDQLVAGKNGTAAWYSRAYVQAAALRFALATARGSVNSDKIFGRRLFARGSRRPRRCPTRIEIWCDTKSSRNNASTPRAALHNQRLPNI